MINNLQNLSEDNINTSPTQEKKPIIFKLESSTFGSIDSSAKVQEKLLKNRQSAKKCRLKKKAYIKALEKKVKLLKSELEENNEDRNGPNYSIKTLLIQTLPKKLEFLSNVLYNNEQLNLRIWDSAGQERFRSITQQFFKNADGIILVYDVTNEETFKQIHQWIEDIQKNKLQRTKVFLVGNKIDDEEKRVVQKETAETFAKEQEFEYFETSAKVGTGIEEMFAKISEQLYKIKKEYRDTDEEHSLKLDDKPAKKKCKGGCC